MFVVEINTPISGILNISQLQLLYRTVLCWNVLRDLSEISRWRGVGILNLGSEMR